MSMSMMKIGMTTQMQDAVIVQKMSAQDIV